MKEVIPEHHILIMQALRYLVPHNSEVARDLDNKIEDALNPQQELVDKVEDELSFDILKEHGFSGHIAQGRAYMELEGTVLTMYFQNGLFSIQDYDWFELDMPHIKTLRQVKELYRALTGKELSKEQSKVINQSNK